LSDKTARKKSATRSQRQRRKGTPKGSPRGEQRPANGPILVQGDTVVTATAVAPSPAVVRTRRTRPMNLAPAFALSRAEEYAYIRADMRRLIFIAAVLLVLMLAILVVVER
jgi:hypothetical protein